MKRWSGRSATHQRYSTLNTMRTNYNNASGNSPKTDEMQRNVMRSKATSSFFSPYFRSVEMLYRCVCERPKLTSLNNCKSETSLPHFGRKIFFIFSLSLKIRKSGFGWWTDVGKVRNVSHHMVIWLMSWKRLATARWSLAIAGEISFHVFFSRHSAPVDLIQLLSVLWTSAAHTHTYPGVFIISRIQKQVNTKCHASMCALFVCSEDMYS